MDPTRTFLWAWTAALIGCGGSVKPTPTGADQDAGASVGPDSSGSASGVGGSADGAGSVGASPSPGGTCGAAPGCNALDDVGAPVTPTCAAGPPPTGQGGAIVDGTYVLTSQTYFGESPPCSKGALSGTLVIANGCIQLVATALGGDGTSIVHASATFTTQGVEITTTITCEPSTSAENDSPQQTFTATPTTFTRFTNNSGTSSTNPDRVEVFAKR